MEAEWAGGNGHAPFIHVVQKLSLPPEMSGMSGSASRLGLVIRQENLRWHTPRGGGPAIFS